MDERALTKLLLGFPAVLGVAFVAFILYPNLPRKPTADEASRFVLHNSAVPLNLPAVIRLKPDFSDQEAVRRYFGRSLTDLRKEEFPGLLAASPGDWRNGPGRYERHQSFAHYRRTRPSDNGGKRRVLELRPVGVCSKRMKPVFGQIEQFLRAYFRRPVRWGDAMLFPKQGLRMVAGLDGAWTQYPILPSLRILVHSVPKDALAVLGVTCTDIYQKKGNRTIFGYGTLHHRAGICSVARLYPEAVAGRPDPVTASVGLLRSLKLIAHETGHMLGLHHCAASQCVMNGINTLQEVDRQPLHLCPICLSKLAFHLRLHVAGRYQRLAQVMTKLGQTHQASWYRRQYLRRIAAPKKASDSSEDEDALPRFLRRW